MVATRSLDLPPGAVAPAPARQAWIDNLRVLIICGVVGAHVSLIYAIDVGWYYEERTASAVAEALLAGLFAPGLLFGMGLLFFIAGLFTTRGLVRKGARRFASERLWRLGVPTAAYLFIVNPAMTYLGDRAMGERERLGDYLRHTYRHDIDFGVAWFIAALLVFSLGWSWWRSWRPAPGDVMPLRRGQLIGAAACIAVASFAVRLVWPFLETEHLLGLNVWEYPQMATLFVLGALAEERGWLVDGLSPELRRFCGRAAVFGVVAVVVVAVGITIADDPDAFIGGLRVQATVIPIVEATVAVSLCLWAFDVARRRWNRTNAIVRAAGSASFAAYLLHAPITIALGAALRNVSAPAEVKFVVVFVLTVSLAFTVGWVVTRSRVAARIL